MQPSFPHSHFFSSLKRLEKRLKLDTPTDLPPPQNQQNCVLETSTESLGTPLYLNSLPHPPTTSSDLQESEAPQEFLSNSPDFAPTLAQDPPQEPMGKVEEDDDDINLLMQFLGLSGCEGGGSQRAGQNLGCDDDGFYGGVVGVKGIKSGKELERLDGWIKHFLNGEKERREPLRLAHLLLGKAAFLHSMDDSDDGFGGLEFPSTIDEFLQNDPPADEEVCIKF
ncbi:PREDICTED: uncharacterized protein LOC109184586 isoform X1 [Ipomoea nil]|uniref:uncharacterized protein LOC109184586 isoform X1 n=1 Tax=Ipomoea nil TaxID=35883 RepID=UPI000900BFCB|nr:PREDICTED: uncharacterized protein LOC109184586 isoform X1 [Ipomoea nil]